MDAESIRSWCLSKKGVTESFPFNEDVLVFKVMEKIFLLIDLTDPAYINLKCNPDYAIELRSRFSQITPGYHMNKKHWNTVLTHGLDLKFIQSLIDHSYETVIAGLPAKARKLLDTMP